MAFFRRYPRLDPFNHGAVFGEIRYIAQTLGESRARCPRRLRDTPCIRPWRLLGGIHAAKGPATGKDTVPDSWPAAFLKACCSDCGSSCDVCSLRVESQFAARLATRKWSEVDRTLSDPTSTCHASLPLCIPTISTGPCPPTVAGPYAAWMPRKSLQGRTCGVSCDGGRARALQQNHSVENTAMTPHRLPAVLLKTMHTDHLDGSLSAHRRGTLRGMDAE